jgi:hypothetical protein
MQANSIYLQLHLLTILQRLLALLDSHFLHIFIYFHKACGFNLVLIIFTYISIYLTYIHVIVKLNINI